MVIYKLKLNMVLVFLFSKFFYGYGVVCQEIGRPTINSTVLHTGSRCFAPTTIATILHTGSFRAPNGSPLRPLHFSGSPYKIHTPYQFLICPLLVVFSYYFPKGGGS